MARLVVHIVFVFLVLLGLFFIVHKEVLTPSPLSSMQGAATKSFSVGITIVEPRYTEHNVTVPSNGAYYFTNDKVSAYVEYINGLTPGWTMNMTFHNTTTFPAQWAESEPSSSVATTNRFGFLEVAINATTTGGSYTIFFQVPKSNLGDVSASNVRLFIYEDSWTALSTTVIDANADPVEFSATTTHFSKFMVAERSSSGSGDSGGQASPSGGGGGGGGVGKAIAPAVVAAAPSVAIPLAPSVAIPAEVRKPLHLPGTLFDVTVSIPQRYQELSSKDLLVAVVKIINVGHVGLVTTDLEYNILDARQQVLFREYATKTLENEVEFIKEAPLSPELDPGDYLFVVILRYGDDVAIAGYPFRIVPERGLLPLAGRAFQRAEKFVVASSIYWISFLLLILLFLALIRLLHRKRRK